MRLLRTSPEPSSDPGIQPYRLEEVLNNEQKHYAILSHRWESEEVLFRDLHASPQQTTQKHGYLKLVDSCRIARENGFDYIWNDTCCINQENSTELSEELNSMFSYYADATVCYVYLNDVSANQVAMGEGILQESKWFSRGWTLQELLAPTSIIFFDRDWKRVGTKATLCKTISKITGIPPGVLLGHTALADVTIAQRMSWAAHRKTKKAEDIAYCLMGIFGVHMPVLYGEGETRAFLRLQEEIIKYNNDPTIFVWKSQRKHAIFQRGLLAWSPSEFVNTANVQALPSAMFTSHTMTNRGILITLRLRNLSQSNMSLITMLILPVFSWAFINFCRQMVGDPNGHGTLLSLPLFLALYPLLSVGPRWGLKVLLARFFSHLASWHGSQDPELFTKILLFLLSFALVASPANISYVCGSLVGIALLYSSLTGTVSPNAWQPADASVHARLPCRDDRHQAIEINLTKRTRDNDWARSNPDQLHYVADGRLHRIWSSFQYQKHTLYVAEEYLSSKQRRFQSQAKPAWRIKVSNEELHVLDRFSRTGEIICFQLEGNRFVFKLGVNTATSASSTSFAVAFGVENHVWVDIITDMKEDLQQIHDSYDNFDNRADVCMRGLDDLSRPLGDRQLQVNTRYIPSQLLCEEEDCSLKHNHCTIAVDIDFVRPGTARRSLIDALPIPTLCGLGIIIQNRNMFQQGIQLASSPKTFLSDTMDPYAGYLAFNHEKTSGELIFNRGETHIFSLVFGIQDWEPWVEVKSSLWFMSILRPSSWISRGNQRRHRGMFSWSIGKLDIAVEFTKPERPTPRSITHIATITISCHCRHRYYFALSDKSRELLTIKLQDPEA